jgi:hypothetical protein
LTYSGEAQSPEWSNYDSSQLTIGGTTSATDAGTYTATFTPTSSYCWSDGSTEAKEVTWSIGKAQGYLELSQTSFTLASNYDSIDTLPGTQEVEITRLGDGEITYEVETLSGDGHSLTLSGIGLNDNILYFIDNIYESCTPHHNIITVNVAESQNYTAPASQTIDVYTTYLVRNVDPNLTITYRGVSYVDGKYIDRGSYMGTGELTESYSCKLTACPWDDIYQILEITYEGNGQLSTSVTDNKGTNAVEIEELKDCNGYYTYNSSTNAYDIFVPFSSNDRAIYLLKLNTTTTTPTVQIDLSSSVGYNSSSIAFFVTQCKDIH